MTSKLLEGFKKFKRQEYDHADGSMPDLVESGQDPEYFIISCIDSRSNPGTIFSPAPGTFFAHKAMGAIVRPYKKGTALAAALQFSLNYNNVTKIIILGHTGCGAVKALIDKIEDEEISSFIDVAQVALKTAQHKCGDSCTSESLHRYAEEEIILQSVENLKTYPSVAKALAENRLTIVPWLFEMETGMLMEYDPETEHFAAIPL